MRRYHWRGACRIYRDARPIHSEGERWSASEERNTITCTCVRIERPFCRSQNELVVIPHYANKYPHMMIYFRVRYTMQAFDATIQQMTLLRVHAYRFLRCQVEYSVVKVKDVAQQHSKSRRSTEKLNVKTSRKPSLQFSTSDQWRPQALQILYVVWISKWNVWYFVNIRSCSFVRIQSQWFRFQIEWNHWIWSCTRVREWEDCFA